MDDPTLDSAWARLTTAERGVARHVALGLTNRQAASLLHVSPHTVDYHLRRIFQKLQLRSRVELARALANSPLTDSVATANRRRVPP